jgi:hypothetical protein
MVVEPQQESLEKTQMVPQQESLMVKLSAQKVKKLLNRIKKSDDGPELMEYLTQLSNENYEAFKGSAPEDNEQHKGYAVCIDSLIEAFEKSGQETLRTTQDTSDFT